MCCKLTWRKDFAPSAESAGERGTLVAAFVANMISKQSRLRATLLFALAAMAPSAAPATAQRPALPSPTGYVNDFAGVLSDEDEAAISRVIDEVRGKSGGEIVVVTMSSLEGRTRDELALDIGRTWGVGRRGKPGDPARNTGLVFLVIPKEGSPDGRGHLKIETGLGTNTFITAAEAGAIADEFVIPAFQRAEYGAGVLAGVVALAHQYAGQFGFELSGDVPPLPERRAPRGFNLNDILVPIIILAVLFSIFGRGGRGGPGGRWRRRSGLPIIFPFPLGGGGWGGGGFGGGGAGRGW